MYFTHGCLFIFFRFKSLKRKLHLDLVSTGFDIIPMTMEPGIADVIPISSHYNISNLTIWLINIINKKTSPTITSLYYY